MCACLFELEHKLAEKDCYLPSAKARHSLGCAALESETLYQPCVDIQCEKAILLSKLL